MGVICMFHQVSYHLCTSTADSNCKDVNGMIVLWALCNCKMLVPTRPGIIVNPISENHNIYVVGHESAWKSQEGVHIFSQAHLIASAVRV